MPHSFCFFCLFATIMGDSSFIYYIKLRSDHWKLRPNNAKHSSRNSWLCKIMSLRRPADQTQSLVIKRPHVTMHIYSGYKHIHWLTPNKNCMGGLVCILTFSTEHRGWHTLVWSVMYRVSNASLSYYILWTECNCRLAELCVGYINVRIGKGWHLCK